MHSWSNNNPTLLASLACFKLGKLCAPAKCQLWDDSEKRFHIREDLCEMFSIFVTIYEKEITATQMLST